MPGLSVLVIMGSAREGRMGEQLAKFVVQKLKEEGHSVELIDPVLVGGDGFVRQPLHFREDPATIPEWMTVTNEKIKNAHALVLVTPEYNCSIPPALTGLLDQFPPASYKHKTASLACYSMGPFGGVRSAAFARPMLSELGIVSLPHVVIVPEIQGKFNGNGHCTDELVQKNVDIMCKELTWYASAIKTKMEREGVPN
ncbi:2-hydroxy-1,4-benzoquinone reductase-like [Oratosquilla oratoria]|uniref:2-hydroxy-1,4-benzoquinone reductase-like n=1 Tax=Oratosquilla oratoria TaxID=337810 RepID=UPI003F76C70E